MRRGLLAWSEHEVPRAALEARVARLRAAMRDDGLGGILIYTNFPRPAAVSYLTHFIPYWSQALLAVFPDDPTVLVSSLSKRVNDWIRETSNIGDLVSTPTLGERTVALIRERASGGRRIGVVELGKLPDGIGRPIATALGFDALVDASALFARIRHPADDFEIALARRAARIAADAIAAARPAEHRATGTLTAAIESAARLEGAEEVIVSIAPDLAKDARLHRIEGDRPLGARFAVRISAAYKGAWVRIVRTYDRVRSNEGPASLAASGLAAMRSRMVAGARVADLAGSVPGPAAAALTAEAQVGSAPLSLVRALPGGAVVSYAANLAGAGGSWLAGEPVLVPHSPGAAPEPLVPR
jgi:hypothetical protein